jgi:hypothetical protein
MASQYAKAHGTRFAGIRAPLSAPHHRNRTMPFALDNPNAREPALSRDHAAGARSKMRSPAEQALAPESDAPMQSASAIAIDGTYVGRTGGYGGSPAPQAGSNDAALGEGTYGFPSGPGIGMPGGEHQPVHQRPDVLPPQYPER